MNILKNCYDRIDHFFFQFTYLDYEDFTLTFTSR